MDGHFAIATSRRPWIGSEVKTKRSLLWQSANPSRAFAWDFRIRGRLVTGPRVISLNRSFALRTGFDALISGDGMFSLPSETLKATPRVIAKCTFLKSGWILFGASWAAVIHLPRLCGNRCRRGRDRHPGEPTGENGRGREKSPRKKRIQAGACC
jgi:hypothetical protein